MNPRALAVVALLTASAAAAPVSGSLGCAAQSGPNTAALVELYTSEGCSSCPPADRQLSRLREALDPTAVVVPLSLHVDYWDYIGWKDPFAQGEFAKRQTWLAHANQQGFVYTPHFFVGGRSCVRGPRSSGTWCGASTHNLLRRKSGSRRA